jgi:hypothetical protein
MQLAFALGHDSDCNAATAGMIVGAWLGYERIAQTPGFAMPDRFVNKVRPDLPAECTVSAQVETIERLSQMALADAETTPRCLEFLPADAPTPKTAVR